MDLVEREIHCFKDNDGKEPAKGFLLELKKKKRFLELAKINTRIKRAGKGNFGDHRFLGGNFLELKIDFGSGYRIYCGIDGDKFIIIVQGGTKQSQEVDIEVAKKNWQSYLKSKNK